MNTCERCSHPKQTHYIQPGIMPSCSVIDCECWGYKVKEGTDV